MKLEKILTPKQLEICKKEKSYYDLIGIRKNLLHIALSHGFIKKKEKEQNYSLEILKEYEIIILHEDAKSFHVECKELLGAKRLGELQSKLAKTVIQKIIPVREFNEKFSAALSIDPDIIEKKIKQFNAQDFEDEEVLSLFEMILKHALKNRVSDIHINASSDFSWLRYRMNGRVYSKYLLSPELSQRFSLIIKEKSNIDLINAQTPQSGGFSQEYEQGSVDFRIEIAPSCFGENIVIRILDRSSSLKSFEQLFPKSHPMHEHIFRFINLKSGFFLTVGPTGSGKTTTLNAIISQRDRLHEIIYTIEDPIEYKIDFVTQFEVNESIDFTFANAIKSVMRQDPDVVVIGEMRDKESIATALKAAHSGHMVYSTLHTTNAYMALERIRDEGGDLFILAYSLSGVIAQRLVPKLCECKTASQNEKAKEFFGSQKSGFSKNGCIKCNFSGYDGRILLSDIAFVPSDMKTRYSLYVALKNSSVLKVWDQLITFSYFDSAKYLYEEGLCDYETLSFELLSLGYMDEN